jgi:hypothetical protein
MQNVRMKQNTSASQGADRNIPEAPASAPRSTHSDTKQLLEEMVAQARDLQQAAGGSVIQAVSAWLASEYLLAAREALAAASGKERFELLRTFVQDWAVLRRGELAAARLQLERERFEWAKANGEAEKEKEFRAWVERPEIREELFPEHTGGLSEKTLRKIEKELHLFGSDFDYDHPPPPK